MSRTAPRESCDEVSGIKNQNAYVRILALNISGYETMGRLSTHASYILIKKNRNKNNFCPIMLAIDSLFSIFNIL